MNTEYKKVILKTDNELLPLYPVTVMLFYKDIKTKRELMAVKLVQKSVDKETNTVTMHDICLTRGMLKELANQN